MSESWINGFKHKYAVTSDGCILSYIRKGLPRKLKPWVNNKGYLIVALGRNCKFLVHRLAAIAFIPNPNKLKEVNHKDNNPKNNNVSNLEWCNKLQNMQHASKQLRMHNGEAHYACMLTNNEVAFIKKYYGACGPTYLASQFHVTPQTICDIGKGRTWKHVMCSKQIIA